MVMFLALHPMGSISLNSFVFARASSHVADFSTSNKLLTLKLLKHGYWYHKLTKHFQNFIDDTMIRYLNSKLDLNLSCAKDFRNLNSMVTW